MRLHWLGKAVVLTVVIAGLLAARSSVVVAQATKLEATIFTYDGQDFVRTKTTLMTADGKSAANTKLDRDSPAFKALVQKRSYTGSTTVFGKSYEASYAPLTSDDGRLTGALFVAVAK